MILVYYNIKISLLIEYPDDILKDSDDKESIKGMYL